MRMLVCLTLLVSSTLAMADAWQLQSDKAGITVYTADIPGQELRAFKGVTTLNAPLKTVVAALVDTPNMPAWFFHMKSARELELNEPGDYRYLVISGIWPVSDRDAVVKAETRQAADGSILLTVTGQPDMYPRQDCCVRIPKMTSSWKVVPVSPTRTEVTLTTKSDPGGAVPRWIANLVANDMPRQTLSALGRQVGKPEYAQVDSKGSPAVRQVLTRFRF